MMRLAVDSRVTCQGCGSAEQGCVVHLEPARTLPPTSLSGCGALYGAADGQLVLDGSISWLRSQSKESVDDGPRRGPHFRRQRDAQALVQTITAINLLQSTWRFVSTPLVGESRGWSRCRMRSRACGVSWDPFTTGRILSPLTSVLRSFYPRPL